MHLPIPLSLEPMEAEPVDDLPSGAGWAYEPKYDGFRCIAFRDGDEVALQSRRQRPLARFFPEVAANIAALPVSRFVLDGELVIIGKEFDTLQLRLHPAASRITKLSRETPATFVAFDLLADDRGRSLLEWPFAERRAALVEMFQRFANHHGLILADETQSSTQARRWLKDVGRGLDGIVAKRLDLPYQAGRREMLKFKLWHTVDCVVGGVYFKPGTKIIEYLLCGLYDAAGRLNYVGRCAVDDAAARAKISPLIGGEGFTGEAPGGPSRWSRKERVATPLRPEQVVEVSADHITAGKFRHGSRLVRWRDDKDPRRCTTDQL
ncbi:MAG TPA: ATP-dependent DNA ligase [Acetobacteraceae bacterium]|nr:ATP-dependent DNA ligase [Acetobacteraceae bacterium]